MLKISNVETFYGKIQALRGVDLNVNEGEIVSLIGSNGAGKSTLLMTISGVNKAKKGNIVFNGENIENKEPHKIVDMGICQVPEGRRIFSRLTVEENLRLGAHANEKGKFYENDIKDVYDLFPVLSDRKTQRGGTLSGGEQQMLAIGRALMGKPKVLLLDEPSLGIAPKLVNQIFISIKNINKEKNVTIFLVEQNAKKALELADRAYVLVNGKVTIKGTGQELLKNQAVESIIENTSNENETSFSEEILASTETEQEPHSDLKEFGVDADEPDLFSAENQISSSDDLLTSSEDENDEDDLEIPAFLRRQKN